MMPEELENLFALPGWVKGLLLSLAAIGGGVAGYASAGFPIPMTVQMYNDFEEQKEVIASTRRALDFAQKVLDRQDEGTPEHAEALIYRDSLQSQLDELTE